MQHAAEMPNSSIAEQTVNNTITDLVSDDDDTMMPPCHTDSCVPLFQWSKVLHTS